MSEPSKAAMEAAAMILYDRAVLSKSFMDMDEKDIAINIDAAMKPERDAAEKMARAATAMELLLHPIRQDSAGHLVLDGEGWSNWFVAQKQALAAYESARGK